MPGQRREEMPRPHLPAVEREARDARRRAARARSGRARPVSGCAPALPSRGPPRQCSRPRDYSDLLALFNRAQAEQRRHAADHLGRDGHGGPAGGPARLGARGLHRLVQATAPARIAGRAPGRRRRRSRSPCRRSSRPWACGLSAVPVLPRDLVARRPRRSSRCPRVTTCRSIDAAIAADPLETTRAPGAGASRAHERRRHPGPAVERCAA